MKWIHVFRREFFENVRKKSFIISTIAAPVIMAGLYAIPIAMVFFEPSSQLSIAVLDRTGKVSGQFVSAVDDTLKDGRPRFLMEDVSPADGEFEAVKAASIDRMRDGDLDALIEITDETFEESRVGYISKDEFNEIRMDYLRDRLNPIVVGIRLADTGLGYDEVEKLTRRVRFNDQKITKSGVMEERAVVGEYILVMFFVMILYVTLLQWGMSIQRGIIEEKSSRVIEVMLSSLEPRDMLIGKILGIGAVGFVQIAIWSALAFALGSSAAVFASQIGDFVTIAFSDVVYFLIFYVLGFLLYSAIFTVIGAICNTEQEAQQLQMIVIMPLVIPLMFVFLIITNPNTPLAAGLSMFPLFTPLIMMARVVVAEPPIWQILLSVVLLILTIWVVVIFSARVFRVGILMYGKRPSLKEVIRWFRYA